MRRSSEWNGHCEAPNPSHRHLSTATTAESRRQQIRMMAKIDHLLRARRLVCPGCVTDSRAAPGSVILPRRFFILRPRATHESANGTRVRPASFTPNPHRRAPFLVSHIPQRFSVPLVGSYCVKHLTQHLLINPTEVPQNGREHL
jgi:hypothetical protein